MATTHIARSSAASRAINYAEKRAVLKDGYNVDIAYAKSEFKQVREIYGNKGRTEAYVSRLSFSPKELDPKSEADQKKILALAKEIYAKTYPDQQVALYVHNDTEALHVHVVIGSINLKTGKKLDMNWEQYRNQLVKNTDEIVKKHGFSVTVPQKRPEKRTMTELKMKAKGQHTWKDQIRSAVDRTMSEAHIIDFKAFKEKLEEFTVSVIERGKELTYGLVGTNYKVRGSKLGDDYKKEVIFNELDRRSEVERQRAGFDWLTERGSRIEEEQRNREADEARKRALQEERRRLAREHEVRAAQQAARPVKKPRERTIEKDRGGLSL